MLNSLFSYSFNNLCQNVCVYCQCCELWSVLSCNLKPHYCSCLFNTCFEVSELYIALLSFQPTFYLFIPSLNRFNLSSIRNTVRNKYGNQKFHNCYYFYFLYTDVYRHNYKRDCIIQQYVFLKLIKFLSSTLLNHCIAFWSCLFFMYEFDAIAQAQCSRMKEDFHWSVIHQYLPLAWTAPLTSAGIDSCAHQVYKTPACFPLSLLVSCMLKLTCGEDSGVFTD